MGEIRGGIKRRLTAGAPFSLFSNQGLRIRELLPLDEHSVHHYEPQSQMVVSNFKVTERKFQKLIKKISFILPESFK